MIVRLGWWRLWLAHLERGVGGPWDSELSLAIDRARSQIEEFLA